MTHENIKIEYVDINLLKNADYNPRKASEQEFKQLRYNIQKFGFVDPVIVNINEARKNVIIGGHFRVRVAKDLGIKSVPVVYLDIADIEKEKELNIRLNRNTGTFDYDILANVFDVEDLTSWGFTLGELGLEKSDTELQKEAEGEFSNIVLKYELPKYTEIQTLLARAKIELDYESNEDVLEGLLNNTLNSNDENSFTL